MSKVSFQNRLLWFMLLISCWIFYFTPHLTHPPRRWKLYKYENYIPMAVWYFCLVQQYPINHNCRDESQVIISRKLAGWPEQTLLLFNINISLINNESWPALFLPSAGSLWPGSDVKQILGYNNVSLARIISVKTQQGKNPQHHPFKDHKNLA